MANKKPAMFVINVQEEETKCTESQLDILLKIHDGRYRLVKKKKRSTVWNVYREIARPDGTKLKWRYYCLGCKRVMQSTGGTTSNLRIHKCHVRYLRQHGKDSDTTQTERNHGKTQRSLAPTKKRQRQEFEEFFDASAVQYSDAEDDYDEEEEGHNSNVTDLEFESTEMTPVPNPERPLLKLFSEEESWSPEMVEEQTIELDEVADEQQSTQNDEDFSRETIKPSTTNIIQIDASAVSEAESYARAWAHAFLKLSEDQKFYAKRSIDELLVLGRLERLNISTVTSLTTNL